MSKIEWTNETNNPIVGCNKVSPGCDNCYALKMAVRNAHNHRLPDEIREAYFSVITQINGKWQWNGKTAFIKSALEKPLKWKKPRMIFVVSMGDLFHESVSFEDIDKIIAIIATCKQHTFQILTKRPERMKEYFNSVWQTRIIDHMRTDKNKGVLLHTKNMALYNLWLGVTAENQEQANKRIPILLQIPAVVHYVSIEPMLSNINLNNLTEDGIDVIRALKGDAFCPNMGWLPYDSKLDWVICGGESGSKSRPMHPDWARSLRDQCKEAEVPFFFKQWGEWIPSYQFGERLKELSKKYPKCRIGKEHTFKDGISMYNIRKKYTGRLLDGKEHNEMPK